MSLYGRIYRGQIDFNFPRINRRLLVLSAADGEIDDSHHLTGAPPRAPDAPELLNAQAALLQQLMRAHS